VNPQLPRDGPGIAKCLGETTGVSGQHWGHACSPTICWESAIYQKGAIASFTRGGGGLGWSGLGASSEEAEGGSRRLGGRGGRLCQETKQVTRGGHSMSPKYSKEDQGESVPVHGGYSNSRDFGGLLAVGFGGGGGGVALVDLGRPPLAIGPLGTSFAGAGLAAGGEANGDEHDREV
jgi:hypothetical protein